MKKSLIIGGAGFIGSHLAKALLNLPENQVTIYDNFSSGKMAHLESVKNHPQLTILTGDAKDLPTLTDAMKHHDYVFHFAANPDIAKAARQPSIDFWEGTYLLQNTLEAMRLNDIKNLLYASGSGVYGDVGETLVTENQTAMLPISTYGASKLSCESMISAYCHMFEMNATVLRFANVVGPNQTHGVGYDFVHRLLKSATQLLILGDGQQSKSYIYVTDVVNAMLMFKQQGMHGFHYYNVATEDYISVAEIADIVVAELQLYGVKYQFEGGKRGWKGDVPIVRFDTHKIRELGWSNQKTSAEAIIASVRSIIAALKLGALQHDAN